ncbi:MAG: hypothetical protein AAGH99_06380 [Planctomycetota bacterium]
MPDPPDEEDVYDLSDEDALDEEPLDEGLIELAYDPNDVEGVAEESDTRDPVAEESPDDDTELEVHPARYCRSCGFDLTYVDVSPCPGCDKEFDPEDESTTRDTPLPRQDNYWLQRPRLAGYALLVLFVIGRLVMGFVAENLGGRFADAVLGFGVVFLLVPWAFLGVYLLLEALEEHHNPKLIVTLPLGFVFGLLLTLGTHPGVMLAAGIGGAFAGFVRTWRET